MHHIENGDAMLLDPTLALWLLDGILRMALDNTTYSSCEDGVSNMNIVDGKRAEVWTR